MMPPIAFLFTCDAVHQNELAAGAFAYSAPQTLSLDFRGAVLWLGKGRGKRKTEGDCLQLMRGDRRPCKMTTSYVELLSCL